MNCKPNELAVVVRRFPGAKSNCVGKIVRTVEFVGRAICINAPDIEINDAWNVEFRGATTRLGYMLGVPDSCLRPIRNPGDNAVDEMVLKVGAAPMTLTEIWEAAHG